MLQNMTKDLAPDQNNLTMLEEVISEDCGVMKPGSESLKTNVTDHSIEEIIKSLMEEDSENFVGKLHEIVKFIQVG